MFQIARIIPKRFKLQLKSLLAKPDMELSLQWLRRSGFSPKYAIDVGAYKGEVTRMIKYAFPETSVLMIEPCPENNLYLQKTCRHYPGCQYINALVGATEKDKVNFLKVGPYSCVPMQGSNPDNKYIQLPMTTLDNLTASTPFSKPDFLKLDVEGYELEVLKGAQSIMNSVEAILLEISVIPTGEIPVFYEVAEFMDRLGFRLYDICTFFYQPQDKALWRINTIFIRKTHRPY